LLVVGAIYLVVELVVGLWAWTIGQTWAALVCAVVGGMTTMAWVLVWLVWWSERRRGFRVRRSA
jgi:hypothetical protein